MGQHGAALALPRTYALNCTGATTFGVATLAGGSSGPLPRYHEGMGSMLHTVFGYGSVTRLHYSLLFAG